MKTHINIGGVHDAPQFIIYNGDDVIHHPLTKSEIARIMSELTRAWNGAPERIE